MIKILSERKDWFFIVHLCDCLLSSIPMTGDGATMMVWLLSRGLFSVVVVLHTYTLPCTSVSLVKMRKGGFAEVIRWDLSSLVASPYCVAFAPYYTYSLTKIPDI